MESVIEKICQWKIKHFKQKQCFYPFMTRNKLKEYFFPKKDKYASYVPNRKLMSEKPAEILIDLKILWQY